MKFFCLRINKPDFVFLAPVAFFVVALAAGVAVAVDEAAVVGVAVAAAVVLVVAAFFVDAFFVGEAERFRLVPPLVDFDLLDDRAFLVLVPLDFLVPLGVFDRLRDFVVVDFFVVPFFLPAEEAAFFARVANLKLPLAPTPLVCFKDRFFVPARKADFKC